MVLCLIALPLFAVLGLFSVTYRRLAKDALQCLFRTMTLRACESGLDDRIKAYITGRLLSHAPRSASFFYRHYKLLSWIFVILLVWSGYTAAVGVYNYAQYGNCNGPASTGFCLFDPTGEYSGISESNLDVQTEVVPPVIEDDDPFLGDPDAPFTLIEFGCYTCQYTKSAEPIVQQILETYVGRVRLQFKTFTLPTHALSYPAALAANCAAEQGQYVPYHAGLFTLQENMTPATFRVLAQDLGLDIDAFDACVADERYKDEIEGDTLMGILAGVKGTPTFFIGDQVIVGPKPLKTFETVIEKEMNDV